MIRLGADRRATRSPAAARQVAASSSASDPLSRIDSNVRIPVDLLEGSIGLECVDENDSFSAQHVVAFLVGEADKS
jgi:hypothetical protein